MPSANRLRQIDRLWNTGNQTVSPGPFSVEVMIGRDQLEHRWRYDWDGQSRPIDPRGPVAILQYTVSGWGWFSERAGFQKRCQPGDLFVTHIPSPHRYWHPAESQHWECLWLLVRHPFVVERLRHTTEQHGALVSLADDHPLLSSMLHLIGLVRRGSGDDLTREQALITLAIEHQRAMRSADPRHGMLEEVRQQVLAHPQRLITATDLAHAAGQSPSAYGHRFRSLTGQTPAQWITHVRLDEARRLLIDSDEPLAQIAKQCGYADANHLCKAFRRRYQESPGAYRRRLREP